MLKFSNSFVTKSFVFSLFCSSDLKIFASFLLPKSREAVILSIFVIVTFVILSKGFGYVAEGLHGDLRQSQRDKIMKRYRAGEINILIATDVVARGIDVSDIEAIFNFDPPIDEEFYVHRIGFAYNCCRQLQQQANQAECNLCHFAC